MNKEEGLKKIKELEKQINSIDEENKEKEAEDLFIKLLTKHLTIRINAEKRKILYYLNDKELVVEQDLKTKMIYFETYKIWGEFERKFNNEYSKTKQFMIVMADKYLNCGGYGVHIFNNPAFGNGYERSLGKWSGCGIEQMKSLE